MAGFSEFFKGLLGSVGNGRENREPDVKQVKRGLGGLGYWEEPAHGLNGILDRELDTGIRDFQSDHDLKVDGWMRPDGATEGALTTRLASADRLRYPDIRVKPGQSWQSKGWGGPRGPFGVPTLRNEKERVDSILGGRPARFNIKDNPDATPGPVWWENPQLGTAAVKTYDRDIKSAAKQRGLDPDLVRAVMWAENARGHYFGGNALLDSLGVSKSKLPMNIRPHFGRLVGAKPEDMTKPEVNIHAGAELLSRIRDRIDKPTPAKIGTLWNSTGANVVTEFGADVARIYRSRPWLRPGP